MELKIPEKLQPLFAIDRHIRWRAAFGGRGGAKTASFARLMVLKALWWADTHEGQYRFVCIRQFQNSIDNSVFAALVSAIRQMGFEDKFAITRRTLTTYDNKIEFVFLGMDKNPQSIASMENIAVLWAEECEYISAAAWQLILPTIRTKGSEVWATWNPRSEDSFINQRLRVDPPRNAIVVEIGWRDNPWFEKTEMANERIEDEKHMSAALYNHIWEGQYRRETEAQVFHNWEVWDFDEPDGIVPYYGIDWGFANDPNVLVRCYQRDKCLFITDAVFAYRTPNSQLGRIFETVKGARKNWLMADNARPETIQYMNEQGFRVKAAKKWQGSVEDGVAFLQSYDKIFIKPKNREIIKEFGLYEYKEDRLTGRVLPKIVDAHNHGIDAVRYALDGLIKKRGGFGWLIPKN